MSYYPKVSAATFARGPSQLTRRSTAQNTPTVTVTRGPTISRGRSRGLSLDKSRSHSCSGIAIYVHGKPPRRMCLALMNDLVPCERSATNHLAPR